MTTWLNRNKRSQGQPLDYSDALDFADPIDGVQSLTTYTNRTKN